MKGSKTFIYGKHAIEEALLNKPEIVRRIYTTESFQSKGLSALFVKKGIKPTNVEEKKNQAGDVSHQGVFAEIDSSKLTTSYDQFISSLKVSDSTCLLLLDEIQDPHNVGAIIRSAAAFGVSGILLPTHSQAPITGSVIKVSAGMAFRVPLVQINNVNVTLRDLKKNGFWTYGLMGEGENDLHNESFDAPTVFVLGNEGRGIREKTKEVCDIGLSISIHKKCESLNVAASCATVLYEWSSQHRDVLEA